MSILGDLTNIEQSLSGNGIDIKELDIDTLNVNTINGVSGAYLSTLNANVQTQLDSITTTVRNIASTNIGTISTTTYVNPLTVSIDSNNFNYSGSAWNSGIYNFSSSSLSSLSASFKSYNAFNGYSGVDTCWVSASNVYGTVSGLYTGSVTTLGLNLTTGVSSYFNGEWLQIQLPIKIVLTSYKILPKYTNGNLSCPNYWSILGSNNGSDWIILDTKSNTWISFTTLTTFTPTNISYNYSYFRIVFHTVQTNASLLSSYVSITQWDLGTNLIFNFINNSIGATGPTGPQGSAGDVNQLRQIASDAGGAAGGISGAIAGAASGTISGAASGTISGGAAGLSAAQAWLSLNGGGGGGGNGATGPAGATGAKGDEGHEGLTGATGPSGGDGYLVKENVLGYEYLVSNYPLQVMGNFTTYSNDIFLNSVNGYKCGWFNTDAGETGFTTVEFSSNLDYQLSQTIAGINMQSISTNISSREEEGKKKYFNFYSPLTQADGTNYMSLNFKANENNYGDIKDAEIRVTAVEDDNFAGNYSGTLKIKSNIIELDTTTLNLINNTTANITCINANFTCNDSYTLTCTNALNLYCFNSDINADGNNLNLFGRTSTQIGTDQTFDIISKNVLNLTCLNDAATRGTMTLSSKTVNILSNYVPIDLKHSGINLQTTAVSIASTADNLSYIRINNPQVLSRADNSGIGIYFKANANNPNLIKDAQITVIGNANGANLKGTMTLSAGLIRLSADTVSFVNNTNFQTDAPEYVLNVANVYTLNSATTNINGTQAINITCGAPVTNTNSNMNISATGITTITGNHGVNITGGDGINLSSTTINSTGETFIGSNLGSVKVLNSANSSSYFNFVNAFANLLTMKWKSNYNNLTNTSDATITVTNPNGNASLDNTGNFTLTSAKAYLQNAYSYISSNITNSSYFLFFNDIVNNKLSLVFKAFSSNGVAADVQMNVRANQSSNIQAAGILDIYSMYIYLVKSWTQNSWIQCYNTLSNEIQFGIRANENDSSNSNSDFMISVVNMITGANNLGQVTMYSQYLNLVSYGTRVFGGTYVNPLSYIRLFNSTAQYGVSNQNAVGIVFKSDNTNTQNISDASITVSSTSNSIARQAANGLGQMSICADTISIGYPQPPANPTGASSIVIGNPNCTVTILGKVNLYGANGSATFVDPVLQKVRVRF